MSMNKAIKHGKEKRKQYMDNRFYCRSARNHGVDSKPKANRDRKIAKAAKVEDFYDEMA